MSTGWHPSGQELLRIGLLETYLTIPAHLSESLRIRVTKLHIGAAEGDIGRSEGGRAAMERM